jgi:hypothetical protein
MRHTCQPRTAGARQGWPVRFDLAVHRGAAWALCMGLMLILVSYLPPLDVFQEIFALGLLNLVRRSLNDLLLLQK